ncbi:septal ring lytic transglycosylase RlpA family protein [Methylobacterium sp. 092160098-2]|uniref:septal ring lytic transglycosylase RlpA family protein n=1 Tax=Methylobacterium sp. 092160098-2 TaxID=3025129 RepID=UPI002381C22F|nr:septal ring lytic transglycosylase RlpA family protein [Methylobacterium sp. 092160098-2]MDE4910370.1 septal ring lytic transglycosylase RlpA family protein [Methylobacterium sp. 092160098-2]
MILRRSARAALAWLALVGSASLAQAETASWYGSGHRTANGERFAADGLTAAHRSLPFGTRVRVTYGARSVVVRINDRGPFVAGRAIDLSRGAARAIGLSGVGRVHLAIL